MKIGLTSVFVHDPIKAFAFYTDVLGFVKRMYMPEHWLAIVASPEDPNGTGLLLEPNHNSIAKTYQQKLYKANIPVIVFTVDNIETEFQKLKDRGVVFKKEPKKTEYGIEAVFEDTCGNLIQLQQVPGD
jgi:predicted enzyme related to lactoylglutathione lyase